MERRDGSAAARAAYEAMAPAYADFTAGYKWERWTGRLLDKALVAGVTGTRLLDVACGTGLSSLVPLRLGWTVTGCDISPAMLALARKRLGDQVELVVADMAYLAVFGEFDVIWSVNDALNYLLTQEALTATLDGMRANLAANGAIVFDVNTLATYREDFVSEEKVEGDERSYVWRGLHHGEVSSGSVYEAEVAGDGIETHVHRQRHFPSAAVLEAADAAGLSVSAIYGEHDGDLFEGLDEHEHTKAVYVLTR